MQSKTAISIRLTPDDHRLVESKARQEHRSISSLARHAILKYVEDHTITVNGMTVTEEKRLLSITQEALADIEAGRLKGYTNADDLIKSLHQGSNN